MTDITGQKFGRLTALYPLDDKMNSETKWHCSCECGNPQGYDVKCVSLVRGNTKSCGCINRERIIEFNKTTKKKYNKYDLSGEYGIGWTTNTNEEFYFDLEDYDKIKDYCWITHNLIDGYKALETSAYDETTGKINHYRFNWLIVGKNYDHINRNALDNRKENLRKYDKIDQNAQNHKIRKDNTSGVTGVNWDKRINKWVARINQNNKRFEVYKGSSFEEAVKARLEAEKEYYGEYAPQQHLYEEYGINNES